MKWKVYNLEAGQRNLGVGLYRKIRRPHKYARKMTWTIGNAES